MSSYGLAKRQMNHGYKTEPLVMSLKNISFAFWCVVKANLIPVLPNSKPVFSS